MSDGVYTQYIAGKNVILKENKIEGLVSSTSSGDG